MSTKAFILIETGVGTTQSAYESLINMKDVVSVDLVTGPYDLIAVISSSDLNAVGDLVTNQINTISGIVRTVTCLGIKE